jgi:ATP-dependent Clp protease ATP-binding subunit ClpX
VKLKFTEGALAAVAKKAVDRKAGARGLRSILEDVMLDIMYEIPSKKEVAECIVNEEAIQKKEKPLVVYHKKAESA